LRIRKGSKKEKEDPKKKKISEKRNEKKNYFEALDFLFGGPKAYGGLKILFRTLQYFIYLR
jgi:hypothetical protein